jgi:hypothetical protein
MAKSVSGREIIRIGVESVAAGPTDVRAGHPASAATLGKTSQDRVGGASIGGAASASPARVSLRWGLSRKQAAAWIRVLLRLQSELPLAPLADELGFSNRQFGKSPFSSQTGRAGCTTTSRGFG